MRDPSDVRVSPDGRILLDGPLAVHPCGYRAAIFCRTERMAAEASVHVTGNWRSFPEPARLFSLGFDSRWDGDERETVLRQYDEFHRQIVHDIMTYYKSKSPFLISGTALLAYDRIAGPLRRARDSLLWSAKDAVLRRRG